MFLKLCINRDASRAPKEEEKDVVGRADQTLRVKPLLKSEGFHLRFILLFGGVWRVQVLLQMKSEDKEGRVGKKNREDRRDHRSFGLSAVIDSTDMFIGSTEGKRYWQ